MDKSSDAGTVNRAHPGEHEDSCRRDLFERRGSRQPRVRASGQVDAGDPKVGVAKLTLDNDERNTFVRPSVATPRLTPPHLWAAGPREEPLVTHAGAGGRSAIWKPVTRSSRAHPREPPKSENGGDEEIAATFSILAAIAAATQAGCTNRAARPSHRLRPEAGPPSATMGSGGSGGCSGRRPWRARWFAWPSRLRWATPSHRCPRSRRVPRDRRDRASSHSPVSDRPERRSVSDRARHDPHDLGDRDLRGDHRRRLKTRLDAGNTGRRGTA
jgi:hypothetical protein